MTRRAAPVAGVLVLVAAVVSLQAARERLPPLPAVSDSGIMYLRSPGAARRLALGYDALAADIYWMRAIQHYGSTKLSKEPNKTYDQLYPLLDLTTSLDPYFNFAYRFGAIFLSEMPPNGPGRPDLAIALLQKGLRAQPDRWEFAQDIGFVHYWWRRDYRAAAEWFERAAATPGAPEWLRPLVAVTLTQGGSRASARELWRRIHDEAEHDWLRYQAELRLQQLEAMDQIDALLRIAQAYETRSGRRLTGWRDLVDAGLLRGTPADPAGYPYQLDVERGAIALSPDSPLNPLPLDPASIGQLPPAR